MRLRVVRAPTLTGAMRLLAEELGPEAVLLSSRSVEDGFEVTGGVDLGQGAPALADPAPVAGPALPASDDAARLAFHGVPEPLRQRLLDGPLEAMLGATLRFGRLPALGQRPLMLVGPPGAGKTLTTAKLAARHVLEGGAAPLIINTDHQRPGATEQLTGIAELLDAPLSHAATPGSALQALALRPAGGAVLIDTPGIDPFDEEAGRRLLTLIHTTKAAVALVMPAGLDVMEAAETARAFALLGATHLIPTRLDIARRLGSVLAAAEAASLLLSEAGIGSGVAEALVSLSPDWLGQQLRRQRRLEGGLGHA